MYSKALILQRVINVSHTVIFHLCSHGQATTEDIADDIFLTLVAER